jgi:hypothetical protein
MDTAKPNRLTLEWLKRNDRPLYVKNTTRPKGQMAINFVDPNGHVTVIKLTRTHLPICLTDRLGWDTILASNDLRACIVKGVVDIIDPDIAERELNSEGAVAETERHQLSEWSAKQAFMSPRVREMDRLEQNKVDPNAPGLEPLGIETTVIQPRIMSMVEKLSNGDLSIKAALSEMKTMEAELRETDCSYIITNGPEGQVRNYAQKMLAQLRSSSAASHDIRDDQQPVMTPEEQEQESQREALARQYQQV